MAKNLLFKAFATILFIASLTNTQAQTGMGVGTNTPAEKLDVNGAVKIGNTSTTNAGTMRWTGVAFEGYDGTQWITFGGGANGWSLTGNSGTNPNTNFIGTTDNQPLVIKANNSEHMRIGTNGAVGFGTDVPGTGPGPAQWARIDIRNDDGDRSDIAQTVGTNGVAAHMFIKHRGTLASPTAVNANDWIGLLDAHLYNGTNYKSAAAISFVTDGAVSGDSPGKIMFWTAAPGANNTSERMVIKSDGNIGIGTSTPTGKLHLADGDMRISHSTGAPTIEFIDPADNSKMSINYQRSNDKLEIRDNSNNPQFVIRNANGFVGIGTSTPGSRLHVDGSIRMVDGSQAAGYIPVSDANGTMTWTDPSTITTGNDGDWTVSGSNQYSAVSGSVGIGTTTPSYKLDVNGDIYTQGNYLIINTSGTGTNSPPFRIDGFADKLYVIAESNANGPATGTEIRFRTSATNISASDRMTIDKNGNVGIATTGPTTKLHLIGDQRIENGTLTLWSNDAADKIQLTNGGTNGSKINHSSGWTVDFYAGPGNASVSGGHRFFTTENGYAERMRITNSGNIGIGITAPSAYLDITGLNNSGTTSLKLRSGNGGLASGSNQIVFGYNGNTIQQHAIKTRHHSGQDSRNAIDFFVWDYGTDANTDVGTKRVMSIDGADNGRVGIGVLEPAEELHVVGSMRMVDGNQATGYIPVSDANGTMTWTDPTTITTGNDGDWTVSGNHIYNSNTGNVGIGTSTATGKLHVELTNGSFHLWNNSGSGGEILLGGFTGNTGLAPQIRFDETGVSDFWDIGMNDNNLFTIERNGTDRLLVDASGNLGVGTVAPTAKLYVTDGTVLFDRRSDGSNTQNNLTIAGKLEGSVNPYVSIDFQNYDFNNAATDYIGASIRSHNNGGSDDGDLRFLTTSDQTLTETMRIDHLGNVGIGTTNPRDELHVEGSIRMVDGNQAAGYIPVSDANGTMTWTDPATISDGDWTVSGADIYNSNTGNVGIGVVNSSYKLELQGTTNPMLDANTIDISELQMRVRNSSASNGQGAGIGFATGGPNLMGAAIVHERNGTNSDGKLHFATKTDGLNGTDLPIRMTIDEDGRVGISTTNPVEKLHVVGKMRMVDGNQAAGYIPVSDANGTMTWVDPTTIATADDGDWTVSGNNQYSAVSGNVGIGTTSASNKLHVVGNQRIENGTLALWSSDATEKIHLTNAGTNGSKINHSTGWVIDYYAGPGTGATTGAHRFFTTQSSYAERMRISSDGNVGIGTTAPASVFNVYEPDESATQTNFTQAVGDAGMLITSQFANGAYTPGVFWNTDNNSSTKPKAGIYTQLSNAGSKLLFGTSSVFANGINSNVMALDYGGKLGIGTDSPYTKLQVVISSNSGIEWGGMLNNQNNSGDVGYGVGLRLQNSNPALANPNEQHKWVGVAARANGAYSNQTDMVFYTNNFTSGPNTTSAPTERMRLTGSTDGGGGNLGLGTTVPIAKLHVVAAGATDQVVARFAQSNTTNGNTSLIGLGTEGNGWSKGAIGFQRTGSYDVGDITFNLNTNNASGTDVTESDEVMRITSTGRVGLGTTNPTQAKFVVNGNVSYNISARYYNSGGANGSVTTSRPLSAYFSDHIATSELQVFSDKRIKNIQGISNSKEDLNTLMGIEITDYTFKDSVAKGNYVSKKVIAQQVEEVYPQAVSTITDVVPDIYQLAPISNGRISMTNDLKTGERVKLIFENREEIVEVVAADAEGFTVNLTDKGQVFVYGREVDDFHTVDYEALSTLNISATQELVKMINQLQNQNANLEEKYNNLSSDVETLKVLLNMNTKAEK